MYYVVDQSNPKEPMEYIRVTREDIFKIKKKTNPQRFSNISLRDNKISLCHYVLQDIDVPYYYDTKPVKVGTIYTYLLNIQTLRKLKDYIIDPFNDIDFILYYESYPRYYLSLAKNIRKHLIFSEDKNYAILNKYMTKPLKYRSLSQTNSIHNYSIYSFYNDFINVESTPTYIFKKFMIYSLKNLINIVSTPQYNSLFKNKKVNDLFQRDYDEILNITNNFPYFEIKKYFINEIQGCVSSTENKYYDTLLNYLKKLHFKYEKSLYNVNDLDRMNFEKSIQFLFEIYCILHLYQSMDIEVSNYYDLFSTSSGFSFETYENTITYKINVQNCDTTWFWNNNFKCLLDYLHDIFINENSSKSKLQVDIWHILKKTHIVYNNVPLEYLLLLKFFSFFTFKLEGKLSRSKKLDDLNLFEIETVNHVKACIEHFDSEILPDSFPFNNLSPTKDINIFFSQSLQNQIFKNSGNLYYTLDDFEYHMNDLFKPAIESYLLFSKHPIDQCSHCHMFFLKTSPNRKFCDSTLTLKSGETCKEEREAITDQKSEYQKTTNDFKQYLQKVKLKGDLPYTRRVYNILEKNKYFDSKKTKNFEEKPNMSKSDTKDLLWMLNSFFNYSYAIMESMNFQKIVKDPTFKDIRYYNNNPENNFTPNAYTDLFEEYKKYTRTNKGNDVTEVFNIYNSLVKFSESKDNTLNFKTIRSKSMQDLNGDDIAKLFEITKIVIHIFFLRLSDWYLKNWNLESNNNKDDPDFTYAFPIDTYAFPEESPTFELSKIQYMKQKDIKALEYKINDAESSDIYEDFIKMNKHREDQVIKLITELKENIKKNHPFK